MVDSPNHKERLKQITDSADLISSGKSAGDSGTGGSQPGCWNTQRFYVSSGTCGCERSEI